LSIKFLQLLYLFQQYGYVIIFAGTFFEGETILVLGGLLANRGEMNFWLVIVTAVAASYLGHVVFYILGKTSSNWILIKFPKFQIRIRQAEYIIRRYETMSLFLTQYIFGIRLASALAFGILNMNIGKFLSLQLISCLVWAILFASLGYWLGESSHLFISNIEWAILVILITGFLFALAGRKLFDTWFRSK
jgi:membrane protein DedA with SNARE-associated domain